jgi:hypothetical protein
LFSGLLNKLGLYPTEKINDIECYRTVKNYDGKNIKIVGINLGELQIGKIGINPQIIYNATQTLLLLDASQYDLCNTIKNIKDEKKRDEYVIKMADDKLAAQKIYRALMSLMTLSENQDESTKKEIVKTIISSTLSSEQRIKELELSNIPEKIKTNEENHLNNNINTNNQSNINLTNTTFDSQEGYLNQKNSSIANDQGNTSSKIEKMKQDNPQIIYKLNERKTIKENLVDVNLMEKIEEVKMAMAVLNDEYISKKIESQLDIKEFWPKLAKLLKEITTNKEYKNIIGSVNNERLFMNLIKISNKIKEYDNLLDIDNKPQSKILSNEIDYDIKKVFDLLDDIFH